MIIDINLFKKIVLLYLVLINVSFADESNNNSNIEEVFQGDWKLTCKNINNYNNCRIISVTYPEGVTISFDFDSDLGDKLTMAFFSIKDGSRVRLQLDNNYSIYSHYIKDYDFNLLNLDIEKEVLLIKQIQNSQFLDVYFYTKYTNREIVNRFNLDDFKQLVFLYNKKY